MSRGTTFRLLRKSRVQIDNKFVEDLVERSKDTDKDGVALDAARFLESGRADFDIVDTLDGTPYNVALEMTFSSVFNEVREFFMTKYIMNPYIPSKSSAVLDVGVARDIVVAANYILLEHFDEKIEEIMDNPLIEPIGSMSRNYENYRYHQRFPNDKDNIETEDYKNAIESLKTIVSAFLGSDEPHDYLLVVEVWG